MLNVKADPYPALIPFISPMTLAQFQKPHTSPPPLPLPLSLCPPTIPLNTPVPPTFSPTFIFHFHSFFIPSHSRVIPLYTQSLSRTHTPSLFPLMGSRPAVCLWTENSKWLLRLTVSCTGARTYLRARARTHTHTHTRAHKDTQTHTR